jgi:hypothetical protein
MPFVSDQPPAPADILGVRIVRLIALGIALLAVFGGLRTQGGGAVLCWVIAGLFLLTAAVPRQFGKTMGPLIAIITALILFMGPHGEPAITARALMLSIPSMLLAGLMINPGIVDTFWSLVRPSYES